MAYQSQTTIFLDGQEITCDTFDLRVTRGRSREIDRFRGASGYISVRNDDRDFDAPFLVTPDRILKEDAVSLLTQLNGAAILQLQSMAAAGAYGAMGLGRTLEIFDGATRVFRGHAEDIDYDYDRNIAHARFDLGDAFSTLANTRFDADWVATDAQTCGARITEILDRDDVKYPAGGDFRDIADGHALLRMSEVAEGRTVLLELQLVEESDAGRLYVDRNGVLVFRGRYDWPGWRHTGTDVAATFTDDDTTDPYSPSDVRVSYGGELLIQRASVSRTEPSRALIDVDAAGNPIDLSRLRPRGDYIPAQPTADSAGTPRQTETTKPQPPRLGARSASKRGLLVRHDADCLARSAWMVHRHDEPDAVISALTLNLDRFANGAARDAAAALDIDDVVTVRWTPTKTGPEVAQTLAIEQVTYESSRLAGRQGARMRFQVSELPVPVESVRSTDSGFFTLDVSTLDGPDVLGF